MSRFIFEFCFNESHKKTYVTICNLYNILGVQKSFEFLLFLDYIHSGGKIRVIVASDNHEKVNAVKDAFHTVFGLATIYGLASLPKNVAAQPVGYAAAKQSAIECLDIIRDSHPEAKEEGTIVVALGKLVEKLVK